VLSRGLREMKVILEKKGGLKVKIRNLLIAVAMLSVLLCGAVGTAYAILGAADDVAGQDLVIPFICGRTDLDPTNTLNTLYTIAEVKGGGRAGTPWVSTDRVLYNQFSVSTIDYPTTFTGHDLLSFDCLSDFASHSTQTKNAYTVTIPADGGKKYLAGYVILSQLSANDGFCSDPAPDGVACTSTLDCLQFDITSVCDKSLQNRFIGWEYLVDLQKGFASGFNAISAEYGVGQNLGEAGGVFPVTAATLYPRVYIHNALSETWNWWIVLVGRNELSCGGLAPAPGRSLTGLICSPEEVCPSFSVAIPNELNVIDMLTEVPQVSSIPGFPKSAFAIGNITETFSLQGVNFTLAGTANIPGLCGYFDPFYSIFAWSYERAQSDNPIGGFNGSWDVVHPAHRNYCTGVAEWIEGGDCGPIN
jgi:hypothetical protein